MTNRSATKTAMTPGARAQAHAPRLTDHALLRFLARSGLDVEGVRAGVETGLAAAHGAALALGGGDHLIVVDGLSFVVRGGHVTTVLSDMGPGDRAAALKPQA